MAIQVKMFMTWIVLFLIFNSFQVFVTGIENQEDNQKIIEKVLKHLNEENNTKYRYQSANIIEAHKDVSSFVMILHDVEGHLHVKYMHILCCYL
jgi:TATA-box binding protein (TBP) (component of TFIID and TFIIIB)